MFGESLGIKGCGSAVLLPNHETLWTFSTIGPPPLVFVSKSPLDFLGLYKYRDVKIFQNGDLEQTELSKQLWSEIIMIKVWELRCESCRRSGWWSRGWCWAWCSRQGLLSRNPKGEEDVREVVFSPICLNTYFHLLSCHKRSNLFNFTKCYWSCWKWSCSPRLLDKWVCVFLEGS